MKIAVTGKGGVGKTTFSSMLSRMFADDGYRVVSVDADPDANLGLALGFPKEVYETIVPISEMKNLVNERTSAETGTFNKMFKLNPKVDDIPDKYCKEYNGVRLLTLGTVDSGGSGCVCPEHVLLKRLCSHLILQNKDVVVMDMEAGIEHLGRGTAQGVDAFIVVVEPGERSLQTYRKVKRLGTDIGVKKVFVVGNKVRNKSDEDFIASNLQDGELLGFIYYNQDVIDSDRASQSPYDVSEDTKIQINEIKSRLMTNC
ncbi:bifunctional carbon monoxide dehydrogenase/acetyl-CoA synthase [[Clostridium] sordellii]|uniref:Bifunctional carbon monoxide dehydrogenase /acetyl-CoA synthase n=1 Tax=Paraclostridium sordellii TaxID=1505 RepID=A0A0A1SL27_PARSO|nr:MULTISPECIES: carbon monoxide dehydrogenase accessory protein CooC [Paeniclostridium]MDU5019112.1 carbon monoxide dehydrogenase accessory protein CooC [Clostridiales bacterium]AUN15607.1 carbon monoxide dehydrogenase [Paeniclostridium sordellii]EPZ60696.1 CO dehydrogenase/acetyl-CoA synthase complex, accessory protein CooC [[Clostridium] sordellii VPI 9048] [Paeniclostridium sordellii VPI 9048]MBW4862656.1 AAA family ATPase [Paeniclostridium sp.]MBW4874352.1 AAA family ATPase [Paeniclostrid